MKPIYKVSSSFLTSYQGCSKRIQRSVVDRIESSSGVTSVELLFGQAFHLFREHYVRFGFQKALDAALDVFNQGMKNVYHIAKKKEFLNSSFLMVVCGEYAQKYPISTVVDELSICFDGDTGLPLVEEYFSIPVIETSEFELHLSGKIDAIGLIGRYLVIEDIKTTSQSCTQEFFSRFSHSPQMRLYAYVINKLAEVLPESPIGELRANRNEFAVSILGVFLAPRGPIFERSNLLTWSPEETKEFSSLIEKKLLEIASQIQEGNYTKDGYVTGACSTFLSQCPFYEPCHSSSEETIIKNKFSKRK